MDHAWRPEIAPEQRGRIAIVTGANTGLGYETAQALASKGAHVILACRDREKADAARQKIIAHHPASSIEVRHIDTGSLASVRQFADAFKRDYQRLDLLINNAGIMITPYSVTPDGVESQLAVNYLGHFLLTGLLLPTMNKTPQARVVSLYSLAANWGGIRFDDLQFQQKYDATKAYSQSKLACLMFGLELNQRMRNAGHGTLSLAAHPGFSQSDLSRHLPWLIRKLVSVIGSFYMQSAAAGALPSLYAALGEDLYGGEAIGPGGSKERTGPPVVVRANADAQDQQQRDRLWSISEALCGFKYNL